MLNKFKLTLVFISSAALFANSAHANDDLISCSTITNDDARLECYDNVVARITELMHNSATSRIGREQAFDEELQREIGASDTEELVQIEITSVTKDPYGKSIFTTSDGRRWKQSTSSRTASIRAGTMVHFEPGAFSSVFMITDSGVKIKVKAL